MKKIFTIVLLACIAFMANSQSLRLTLENGSAIENNAVIDVSLVDAGEEVNTYVGYENLTNEQLGFYVKREVLSFNDNGNAMLQFCIGSCYTGDLSDLITIEPNAVVSTSNPQAFHSTYMGRPSDASVKYTFYNSENESDCISFTINYKSGVGISQSEANGRLTASPNPATNNVSVSYSTSSNNSHIVIKNLTGKEVYRTSIHEGAGNVNINVADFAAGVYFYGIESDGKMICTKKLLVK